MDPLSIAGSVAGLISLSDTVFRKLYRYVKDVKSAEKGVQDLKNEVAALNGVLHNLHLVAQDLEKEKYASYSIRPDHVNSCLASLYKLDEKLQAIGLSFNDKGKLRNTVHKLAWPFKALNTKEFMDEIRQHRNTLSFALSADSMSALLKSLSKQDDILQHIAAMDERLRRREQIDTRIAIDEQRKRVLDYFLVTNPNKSFKTSLKLRHPTTGFWLTESQQFVDWLRGSGTHLWLSGIPGAGKTVLSSLVVQDCLTQSTSDRAVAFFYCDYKNVESQSAVNILGSLASQLARQDEESFRLLKSYYETLQPQHQSRRDPEADELVDVIRDMADRFEDVRIIVDGLDECGNNSGETTRLLASMVYNHSSISLALLSRDEQDIRDVLEPPFCHHIEIAAQTKDLDHYVRSEIEKRMSAKRLRLKSTDLKEEIVTKLVTRADGMFRWVSCQLDELCELHTDAARRQALTELPKTLPDTYNRVLMRVKEPSVPLVRRTLQWIAYASPKLKIEELTEIVSVGTDDKSLNPEAHPDAEDLLRSCGSLIRRAHGSLELAHFTCQEFLEAISPADERLQHFRLSGADRLTLAQTCVNYLSLSTFDYPPSPNCRDFLRTADAHPFLRHACAHLLKYVADYSDDASLLAQLQKLFRPNKSYNLIRFMLLHMLTISSGDESQFVEFTDKICSHKFGPLHAAAMLHLKSLGRWLIDQGCDVNQESLLGDPLECALFGTSHSFASTMGEAPHLYKPRAKDTIMMLLNAGAVCGKRTTHGVSFSYAAACGPITLSSPFAILLNHGMSLESDAITYLEDYSPKAIGSLLQIVDRSDHATLSSEIRLKLLELANLNDLSTSLYVPRGDMMDDRAYLDALAYAIKFNQVESFEELICDQRFSVDMTPPEKKGTLLHLAAVRESLPIMHRLLNLGFSPSKTDEKGRTVLHIVAMSAIDDDNLLRLLIGSGAAQIADSSGRSAWQTAASSGKLRVLELLLEKLGPKDPSLSEQSKDGYTPILEAIRSREAECALLLAKALCEDKQSFNDPRIIQYTVANGFSTLLEELLRYGADPHATSSDGRNALFFVTAFTAPGMLDLLHSHGLDSTCFDTMGRSPLTYLLACDSRADDLRLAGIQFDETGDVHASILEKLATKISVSVTDDSNHTAWFYFCTEALAFYLKFEKKSKAHCLWTIFSVLIREDATSAFEKATGSSAIVLVVDSCLRFLAPSLASGLIPPLNRNETIETLLYDAFKICVDDNSFIKHPQLVALFFWSILKENEKLVARLLELGMNVHLATWRFEGKSAIELCCTEYVNIGILRLCLTYADPGRLATCDKNGRLYMHHLCTPGDARSKKADILKLEAFLEAGIDPNARSRVVGTAAHWAVKHGCLDTLRLLVRFKADLRQVDNHGMTLVQLATDYTNVEMLGYLHSQFLEEEDWTTKFSLRTPNDPYHTKQYQKCSLLHVAAMRGSSVVLEFLKQTVYFIDLDVRTEEGMTPLHFAVCAKNPAAVKWLIANGADVNISSEQERRTALHFAFRAFNADKLANILALLEAGAGFTADSTRKTPEMDASPALSTELLRTLPHCGFAIPASVLDNLQMGQRLHSVREFYAAIEKGNLSACKAILKTQPQLLDSPLECGSCTPLIEALAMRKEAIVNLLLDEGASTVGVPCYEVQDEGPLFNSALHIAISNPSLNVQLERLLNRSLQYEDHWSTTREPGQLLHLAAVFNPDAISILFEHIRAQARPKRGGSWNSQDAPVIKHDTNRFTNLVRHLLASRVNPDLVATYPWLVSGGTALHVAAWNRNLVSLEKLLFYGADINPLNEFGRTPLHLAANANCAKSTAILLQYGATLRPRDVEMQTPLMLACGVGATEVISLLLDHEIDRDITDLHGATALHHAAQEQCLHVFVDLINAGWDAYRRNRYDCSPIYYALSDDQLRSYVLANGLDLEHLAAPTKRPCVLVHISRTSGLRCVLQRFPKAIRAQYLNQRHGHDVIPLVHDSLHGRTDRMNILIKEGASMSLCNGDVCTALNAACLAGQLASVRFLVRHGAELECSQVECTKNALRTASKHFGIVYWFLVERHVDQPKITHKVASGDEDVGLRPWSGVRQVEIPLQGRFERPMGVSSLEYAVEMHHRKEEWRSLVPLGWDTVAHLTPLVGEE